MAVRSVHTSFAIVLAAALLSGCAVLDNPRAPLDARAAAARSADDHEAIARDYDRYARRLAMSSEGSFRWGDDEERMARRLNEETPGQRPRWISLGQHWMMRAEIEAREADEAFALAQLHRREAEALRAKPQGAGK